MNENKIKGTIRLKNLNTDSLNGKSFDKNDGQGRRFDFSNLRKNGYSNDFNTNYGLKVPQFQKSNTLQGAEQSKLHANEISSNFEQNINQIKKPMNQFRKIDFSSLSIDKQHSSQNNQKTMNQDKHFHSGPLGRQQLRKMNFSFKTASQERSNENHNGNNYSDSHGNNSQSNRDFNRKNNSFFTFDKRQNANLEQKKSSSNFLKKSNTVKVKLKNNDAKKNFERQSFKKTVSTGGNIDKYSINGVLKTMSNNIELNTEIDDALGNVISIKLSGINTSGFLQKERKIRMSSGDNKNKVNFNVPIVREVKIYNNAITLSSLADQMAISIKELMQILRKENISLDCENNGDVGDITVDGDIAEIVVSCCGHKVKRISDDDVENDFKSTLKNSRTNIKTRAPIVTIMGHVDHGKTTLLDTIRKSSVVNSEAGGITQHIGAYRTKVGDKWITFLDTPGHAAFTQMRARGAKITDIVVIVVAADDGIMPQTEEAINHSKAAGVPIIIAINKIDKPEADIERTKQMLLRYEIVPEELGGDVMIIPISAKENKNVDKLLEAILLQAEVLDLKAPYDGASEGYVVEAKMDKKRGALATVIVKEGTLRQGDFVIAGEQFGKVKCMFNENGEMLKIAEPSVPVEILGLGSVPEAGDVFYAVKNEKEAKEILAKRQEKAKVDMQKSKSSCTATDLLSKLHGEQEIKKISFIIKADTKGSLEAIVNTIEKLKNDELKINVAHSGIGAINENDVSLASSCNGYIMTFNTQKADKKVLEEAEKCGIEIRNYNIIYQLFDDIKDILSGKLKPITKKVTQGHAEVKMIFEISKVGKIAGCLVKDGIVCRNSNVAIIRNGEVVFETKCNSLKHEKENVKDVKSGQECGIGLEKIDGVESGDILEFFTLKEEKRSL